MSRTPRIGSENDPDLSETAPRSVERTSLRTAIANSVRTSLTRLARDLLRKSDVYRDGCYEPCGITARVPRIKRRDRIGAQRTTRSHCIVDFGKTMIIDHVPDGRTVRINLYPGTIISPTVTDSYVAAIRPKPICSTKTPRIRSRDFLSVLVLRIRP